MCFLECFCVFSDEVARFLALLNSEGLSRQEFRKLSLPTTINQNTSGLKVDWKD